MARLMLSAGMFSLLAARMAVRKRGLLSGSPPPFLAAMLISLIRRVKILPRLASSAPFLCLIVAHLEWPDMHDLETSNFNHMPLTRGNSDENAKRVSGQNEIIALLQKAAATAGVRESVWWRLFDSGGSAATAW